MKKQTFTHFLSVPFISKKDRLELSQLQQKILSDVKQ